MLDRNKFSCRNKFTDIKSKLVVIKGERKQGYGINIHKLLYVKQISNKDILYSTGDYSHYLSL